MTTDRALKPSLFLFLGALALRMLYLLNMSAGPYFVSPQLDELNFDLWARRIAFQDFWGGQVFSRGPVYPYFLGLCYKLFGHDLFIPRALQCIIGALNVVLVYRIGRRAFGPREALLAGIAAAAYPLFIFFDGELLITTIGLFFNLLMLLLFLRWCDAPLSPGRLVAAGVACGLGALARPNILLVTPFLAFWVAWVVWRAGHSRTRGIQTAALLAAIVTATILPATIRNVLAAGDLVLISCQGGINFYVGNNANATGYSAATPRRFQYWTEYEDSVDLFARRQAEIDLGRPLKASEVSRHWGRRAWADIFADPGRAAVLTLKKTLLFWSAVEIKNNKYIPFVARFSPILRVTLILLPFGLIAPLGLAAMTGRRPSAQQGLLLGFLVFYMASVVAFFVYARYRLPVVPVLILYAARFVVRAADHARAREWKTVAIGLALAAAWAIPVWVDPCGLRRAMQESMHQEFWAAGNGCQIANRLDEAEEYYLEALELKPDYRDALLNLGKTRLLKKDFQGAADALQRLLTLHPDDAAALTNLALAAQRLGDTARAERLWRMVLHDKPRHAPALLGLGDMLIDLRRPDEALPMLQLEHRLRPDNIESALALARLHHNNGDPKTAARWIKEARRINPQTANTKLSEWGML